MHTGSIDKKLKPHSFGRTLILGVIAACAMLTGASIAEASESKPPEGALERDQTMRKDRPIVLVVGASGSIGKPAVAESVRRGYRTRALVRDPAQASLFDSSVEVVVGDLTRADTLGKAVEGVSGVIFTHGINNNDPKGAEEVNYGAVRNVLTALKGPARIALMTTVGVTKPSIGHDWKRRGERLVRVSGLPYTIVRPGWFDYNAADQHRLVMRQGDTHWAGSPADGVVSRDQIAQVLVASLTSVPATGKTFELVAEAGPAQTDLDPLFTALPKDLPKALDAIGDKDNLPAANEPGSVTAERDGISGKFKQ